MNTHDQGLAALEDLVSQAIQQLFKEYPWVAAAHSIQMENSEPLPLGKTRPSILSERFDKFVDQDTSRYVELCYPELLGAEEPGSLTAQAQAQAKVLAGRLQHGINGEFPGVGNSSESYPDSPDPLSDPLKGALVGTLYVEILQQRFIKQWQGTTQAATCPEGLLAALREELCAQFMPQETAVAAGLSARQWFVQNYLLPLLPALQGLLPEGGYHSPLQAMDTRVAADAWLDYQLQKVVEDAQEALENQPKAREIYQGLLPDFLAKLFSETDKYATLVEASDIYRGQNFDPLQPPRLPPIDPEDDRPVVLIKELLCATLSARCTDTATHLCSSFAVLQSQLSQLFSTVMGCRFSPSFSSLLQLELYTYLFKNPIEASQKSLSVRQAELIYGQCSISRNWADGWFTAIAQARPELQEAVSMIVGHSLSDTAAKHRGTVGFSALSTPMNTSPVDQLAVNMASGVGDGGPLLSAGTPVHELQTAMGTITHQGGLS